MTKGQFGLEWSDARTVNTKHGERTVRSAVPTKEFSDAWAANKHALKSKGYSLGKNWKSDEWEVSLWLEPGQRPEENRPVASSGGRAFTAEESALIIRVAKKYGASLPAELLAVLGIDNDAGRFGEPIVRSAAAKAAFLEEWDIAQRLSDDDDSDIPF